MLEARTRPSFVLGELPYAGNALEPMISAGTLSLHHGKHHAAYVARLNELTDGTSYAGQPLEAVVAGAAKDAHAKAIFDASLEPQLLFIVVQLTQPFPWAAQTRGAADHEPGVKSQPTEEPDVERVREEISALTRDLTLLIDKLKTAAVDGSGEAVRESVEQLRGRARMLHKTLGAQAERSAKAVTRQIEAHPVVSLLVAFGIGFLASRLLSR